MCRWATNNVFVCLEPNRNQINGEVLVILRDVNDNKPELPSPDEFPPWTVSERELEVIYLMFKTSSPYFTSSICSQSLRQESKFVRFKI